MLARTQVMLDPEAHRKARTRASELGISLAEYFRRLVARDVDTQAPDADPSVVFDLGDSGGSDVARHEDAYVAQAIAEEAASTRHGRQTGTKSRARRRR